MKKYSVNIEKIISLKKTNTLLATETSHDPSELTDLKQCRKLFDK